jgi:hypothetical protein
MKLLTVLTLIVALLFTGCVDNSTQLTLAFNHAQVGTQVADLSLTATVQVARARTTLDFITTRSAAAATQSQFLESTLVATGFAPESLANFRQQQIQERPTPTITPTVGLSPESANENAVLTTTPTQATATATATVPAVSPYAPVQAASATQAFVVDVNAPHLENPVLATGVDSDDCAIGVTTQFSTSSPAIYVVAEAVNVPSDSVIESRWFRGVEPVGPVYTFAPDFNIERACIWFFVDSSDFEFIAGQYSVDLTLNGASATPLLSFSIGE